MIIAAVSDLDVLDKDLEPFYGALKKAKKPDLLLFAGDMYKYREPIQYKHILNLIKNVKWNCQIVACLGNREFDEDFGDIKKYTGRKIKFLNDESTVLKIGDKTIGVVGTRGCLDKPTWWQITHIKNIFKFYANRYEKVSKLLKNLETDIKILLMHYAPTYKTLVGENKDIYGGLGYKKFEDTIKNLKPTFVIHGHADYGIPLAFVDSVPIFNVNFNVNKKIVEINPEKLPKP